MALAFWLNHLVPPSKSLSTTTFHSLDLYGFKGFCCWTWREELRVNMRWKVINSNRISPHIRRKLRPEVSEMSADESVRRWWCEMTEAIRIDEFKLVLLWHVLNEIKCWQKHIEATAHYIVLSYETSWWLTERIFCFSVKSRVDFIQK